MIFAITTLVSALSISCIAAYFSIIGLATIFPGSMMAVVIMGSVLEVGKIIAALWLHKNWAIAPRAIKGYLLFAIFVLMGITSMGIFGFLSKSHIEHEQQALKAQAQIEQIESKIKRENEFIGRQKGLIAQAEQSKEKEGSNSLQNINIEKDKIDQINSDLKSNIQIDNDIISGLDKRLSELNSEMQKLKDSSGGLFSSKSKKIKELEDFQSAERTSIKSKKDAAEKRVADLRQKAQLSIDEIMEKIGEFQKGTQGNEENREEVESLNAKITESLDRIESLELEKFNHSDGTMQLEAEIGPVKYVAELISDIFGVQFDLNQAVRAVIIILIFVFDPLAILLVIAAHMSLLKHFPSMKIETSNLIEKENDLILEAKNLEQKEHDLIERKKDLDQEIEIVELREAQTLKYNEQISKSKDEIRKLKIQSEKIKLAQEDEDHSSAEISLLEEQKGKLKEEIKNLKNKEAEIISAETQSLKIDISNLEQEIKEKDGKIDELQKENKSIREISPSNFIIKEKLTNGRFKVSVRSKLGGTHEFLKGSNFTEAETLNCQAISCEIDEICPQRKGPLLLKVFNSSIKKYLEDRLDNREYKKLKPEYNFRP